MTASALRTAAAFLAASALTQSALASTNANEPTERPGAAVELQLADLDGDGLDEALVLNGDGGVALLANLGEGRFEDITLPSGLAELEGASCALFADFDGDGLVDLFAGSSEKRLWRNLGGASFVPMNSGIDHDLVDWSASAVDHDKDGRLDLLVHTEAGDLLYRNTGESRFERVELPGSGARANAPSSASDEDSTTSDSSDAANLSPTRRRLRNWMRARNAAAAGSNSSSLASSPNIGATNIGNLPLASLPSMICAGTIVDQSTQQCIVATSTPTLGTLYPLSTNFNVSGAGSVGIGTATPFGKLHVAGTNGGSFHVFDFPGAGGQNLVAEFNGGTGFGPQVRFQGAGGGYIDIGESASGDFVVEGNDSPRLTVTNAGNVGVGTTTPTEMLDVKGNAIVQGPVFSQFGDTANLFIGDHANRITNLYGTGLQIVSYPGSTASITVQSGTGNVGIGTDAPTERLDVQGNANVSGTVTGSRLASTVATGTAPLTVSSTTKVTSLNADLLDGLDSASFSQLGNSIESGEITNGTIGMVDLGQNGATTGQVIKWNGSAWAPATDTIGSGSQFLTLGPGAFRSDDSNLRIVNNLFDGVWATGGTWILAPVNLPSGARVLSVKAYVNDTQAGANLNVAILFKDNASANSFYLGSPIVSFEVLAGASGFFNQTFVASNATISGNNAYYVFVNPTAAGWPGNNTLAVQNIVIEWRMP